jgi:hypothetical protein
MGTLVLGDAGALQPGGRQVFISTLPAVLLGSIRGCTLTAKSLSVESVPAKAWRRLLASVIRVL